MTEEMTKNELIISEDEKIIGELTERKTMFCSLNPTNDEDKMVVYNAMNNPAKRISDCINTTINVKDVFCEVVQCKNNETGEITTCPRIVLIDDKGIGYQAVSIGIYSAIKKLIAVFGEPTWDKPIKLKVVQVTKGERKMLNLEVAK